MTTNSEDDNRYGPKVVDNDEKNPRGYQKMDKLGMLEAVNGNVVLRGRHGERDHIYPLEKAIRKYYDTRHYAIKMMQTGFPNWDVMMDLNREFKFMILEALKQRRKENIPIPQILLDFEAIHGDDPVIKVSPEKNGADPVQQLSNDASASSVVADADDADSIVQVETPAESSTPPEDPQAALEVVPDKQDNADESSACSPDHAPSVE